MLGAVFPWSVPSLGKEARGWAALALAAATGALVAIALATPTAAAQPPVVAAYPSPGTQFNLPATQIAFRGVPASQIGQLTVAGSVTGVHGGKIEPDSDGQGGSFIPDKPFTPGETVTVTSSLNVAGGSSGKFSFAIERPSRPIKPRKIIVVPAGSNGLQYFHSRPDLVPPSVTVYKNSAPASEGDIFVAPQYGPSQNGPMILDPTGKLVWFLPMPVSQNTLVTDFRVQTLAGQPVLTWWQGGTNLGTGEGEGIIFDHDYKRIDIVHAGNGLTMDLHEFLVTPQGQAYVIAVSPVSHPSVPHKPVFDSVVQEIDIKTGLVEFEWHALDHVPLSDSYFTQKSPGQAFDPYHANSVGVDRDGNLIVSMRNTSAVYKINRVTGQVIWRLGGKHSSFKMGRGTSTWFQHDALVQSDGTVTVFDDGGGPPTPHPYARGIRVALDTTHMTASLVTEYPHSPKFSTNFEGGVQMLSGGDVFLGWGQQPYFSEDDSRGRQIFDARFTAPSGSYRAYRFPWSAQPPTLPAIAVGPGSAGTTNVYASWNGATTVSSWRVLAGPAPRSLTQAWSQSRSGFETTVRAPSQAPVYAVQALDSRGNVLATSSPAAAPARIALYGRSAFVSNGGTGAVPAGCFDKQSCRISTTVYSGRNVIARTGPEKLPVGRNGLLYFTLTGSGRSALAHARGHRLVVTVVAHDTSGTSGAAGLSLVPFRTSGNGPRRSAGQAPSLQTIGATDFVSSGGTGGILAACYATTPCLVKASVAVGNTVIATTGRELLGENQAGYVIFSLTAAGRSMLAHASGNQLGAQVTLTSGRAKATASIALVRFS
jgi:hypothetical protein